MPRAKCKFTQTDVKRGIKAIESAGLKVGRVEIQEEKIVLFTDSSNEKAPEQNSAIDLERWLDKRGKNHARPSQGH